MPYMADGSGGRHQVATLLSLSALTTQTASILSAHHGSHDSQSRECTECLSKRSALRPLHSW